MPPPQLAGNTPVLDIFKPLVICGCPVLGMKLNLAFSDGLQRYLGNAFSWIECVWPCWFAHCDKPLIREHGFKHLICSVTPWLHHFVRLGFDQIALLLKFVHDGFTSLVPI